MKKIITFSFALMASATMFGQTTLWDGENQNVGSQGGFWNDGSPTVVENPEKDGINTSDKCLKFIMSNDKKVIKLPFRDWITPSMDGSKRISLMIKKSQNENLQIELSNPTNGSEDYWKRAVVWYGGDNKWQKVVLDFSDNGDFDYPGVMTITAQTGDVEGNQEVYIDNVTIEPAAKVNGELLSKIEDGSLSGNINLTGAWMKGNCLNADGDWKEISYNDFNTLASKLSNNATSINLRETKDNKDVDINAMRGDHSNVLVFTNEAYDADNVVANGKCAKLVLTNAQPFATPEGFDAASVSITRPVFAGKNTMCLPFWVSKEDLGANTIATYVDNGEKDGNTIINFEKKDAVDANVPFIAQFDADSNEPLKFTDKGVVNTPAEMGNPFTGIYTPGSATGKYGLNANGLFQKGGDNAKINAFSAYLTLPEAQEAKSILLAIGGETTGINAATIANGNETVKVYNLQGRLVATAKSLNDLHLANGVYIVNNKKVIVK